MASSEQQQQAFDSNTRFLVCVTVMNQNPADGSFADRAHGSTGSARRRRERRLRSMLRHERMSVATALAEKLHHSACRSVPLMEELVEHEKHNALRGQKTASGRGTEFFDVFDEELGGGRPPPLPEVAVPQAQFLQRTVESIVDAVPLVPLLDDPVPQTVEQLQDVLQFFDRLSAVPEPVIEAPKIYTEDVPMRAALRATQLAEQLVEVPTIISNPLLLLLQRFWSTSSGLWSRTLTF